MLKKVFSVIPGFIAAVLPNATCPACWPVYAGVLSSLGLGFLMQGNYFFLVVGTLLAVSLFSLFYKASSRRGYTPFVIGSVASLGVIVGRLANWPETTFYLFAALLVLASVWNNWPQRKPADGASPQANSPCPNCGSQPSRG